MTRQPRCKWLSWDAAGRPSCEHGPAAKSGNAWYCRLKQREAVRRYRGSEKGRVFRQRENASENARSSKQLYELTRVRVR